MSFIYNYFFPPEIKFECHKEYDNVLKELIENYTKKEVAFNQLKMNYIELCKSSKISRPSRIMHIKKRQPRNLVQCEQKLNKIPRSLLGNMIIKPIFNQPNKNIRKYHNIKQPNQWKK